MIDGHVFDDTSLKTIIYNGTESDWQNVLIVEEGNNILSKVNFIFINN